MLVYYSKIDRISSSAAVSMPLAELHLKYWQGRAAKCKLHLQISSSICVMDFKLGVEHKDLRPQNMLWNAEANRVLLIDFERSTVTHPSLFDQFSGFFVTNTGLLDSTHFLA
jgi:hypothetical protein